MRRIHLFGLVAMIVLILYACNLRGTPTQEAAVFPETTALSLAVQAQNGNDIFNTVGQVINFAYTLTNSGTTNLTGIVSGASDKGAVTCAALNSVGDLDNDLDSGETVTCTSSYSITQADLDNGSVTITATVSVGGVASNVATTTVQMTRAQALAVTGSANPTTYNQANQTITFTISIRNTGTATLGPAQFTVQNSLLGTVNCGGNATLLASNEAVTCNPTYITNQNDMGLDTLTFNLTASGAGAVTSQTSAVTVENTAGPSKGGNTDLAKGTTLVHQVNDGEWMLQIARCYGADFNAVRNANLQVIDPNKIWPVDKLTIPNIGSNGTIYGPPCVIYYTVVSGDTWNSIAQKYNADLAVLMEANKTLTLAAGVKLKIPINSAGGNPIPPGVQPIRINLPTNPISGTVEVSKGKVRYVLAAAQGQTLNLKLTAPVNEVALAVSATNGAILKPQDTTFIWSGIIPATGDYYIDIVSIQGASNKVYTLEVSLTNPTSAFERVADINTGAGDSNPSYLEVFNGILYFNAAGLNTTAELWQYDSVAKAARRVAEVHPGAGSPSPTFLAEFNGALYFSADGNDGAGVELWRFNGNATGRLTDINPGGGHANPAYMTVYNGFLYFSANGNDGAGVELWRTDGTTSNRVADIHSGPGDANPAYLAVYNNVLYFSAISADGAGNELWKYDGVNAPARVTDINPGVGNANPAHLAVFNNILYFSANDGTGTELWKYDGTTPSRAADINPGAGDSFPTYLTVFNNVLYFSANGNDGNGYELWKFDGVTASRVSNINASGDASPAFLTVYNNELYFQANGNDGAGKELWKYKGQ